MSITWSEDWLVSTGPAPPGDAHLKPLCYPIRKPLPWLPCTSLSDESVLTISQSVCWPEDASIDVSGVAGAP